MNWTKIVPQMTNELQAFVNGELSAKSLYRTAVSLNLGPEIRPLVRSGADRARKVAREALRRRNLLV